MRPAAAGGGVLQDDEVRALVDVLVGRSPVIVYVVDAEGICTFSAGAPLARVGLAPGEVVGRDVLASEAADGQVVGHLRAALAGTATSYFRVSPDGVTRFQTWLEPVLADDGSVRAVVGVALDVTDAWRAEAAEHARVLEQQDVLHQLIAVQDAERRRISAGLHDDTVQVLAALALRVSTLRRRLPGVEEAVRHELSAMARDLSQAGERLRDMVAGLQPELLVRHDLRGALEDLVAQGVGRDGAATSVRLPDGEEPPHAARRVLYEIAVEAVGNVRRHAGARTVGVVVEREGHGWRMEVVDDGRGISPGPRTSSGFGLASMRQRAVAAGGTFEVDSLPGRGTTVRVHVPDAPPFPTEGHRPAADVRGPLEHVLENVSDAFVALDTSWRYVYVNRRAADLLGTTPERMLGRSIWTLYPDGGAGSSFAQVYRRAVREQRSIELEDYFAPMDRWFRVRAMPSSGGLTIYFDDVTERRRLQERQQDTDVGAKVARLWFAGLASHADPVVAVRSTAQQLVGSGLADAVQVEAAGVAVSAGSDVPADDVQPVTVGGVDVGEVRVSWPGGRTAYGALLTVMLAQALAVRLAPGAVAADGEGGRAS